MRSLLQRTARYSSRQKILNTESQLEGLKQKSRLSEEGGSAMSYDYLYHAESIQAALNQQRRQVYELLVTDCLSPLPRVVNIVDLVQQRGIPSRTLQKAQLNSYAHHKDHSQVVLKCSRIQYQELPDAQQVLPRVTVMMDQLTDPQNVGSILQTCHFMGVGLVANRKNKCALTPTVSKISGGALEMMDIY